MLFLLLKKRSKPPKTRKNLRQLSRKLRRLNLMLKRPRRKSSRLKRNSKISKPNLCYTSNKKRLPNLQRQKLQLRLIRQKRFKQTGLNLQQKPSKLLQSRSLRLRTLQRSRRKQSMPSVCTSKLSLTPLLRP